MQYNIIETESDFQRFVDQWNTLDCIIDIVLSDIHTHPCVNLMSSIHIKIIGGDYYIIPVHNSESSVGFTFDKTALNHSTFTKYTCDRKSVIQLLPHISNVVDINVIRYLDNRETLDINDFNTKAHEFINNRFYKKININNVIPLLKHHERFVSFCEVVEKEDIIYNPQDLAFRCINYDFMDALSRVEINGIQVNEDLFKNKFDHGHLIHEGKVYSQYNIFTSTTRPSNRFGGINYAALNKDDGSRNCFISRYGNEGGILYVDYSSFHPRLIGEMVGYNVPADVNMYEFLGKQYFGKECLTKDEIDESKKITFRLMYGGIDEEFKDIQYLKKVSDYIDLMWDTSQTHGYAHTHYFNRKVYINQIEEVNKNKLFNYLLQSNEGEHNCKIINNLHEYLKDKMTKIILYTYDGFTFDLCKNDGANTVKDIVEIVEDCKTFPTKVYFGKDFGTVQKTDFFR
jgi:hypothetical protein